jgi:protein involved in polysaccharide export with SLBB domain
MRLALLSCLFWLSACATGPASLPPLLEQPDGAYRLGSGDVLQVVVFDEPELSGEMRVGDDGRIVMALAGAVTAEGLTLDQLRDQIVERLRASAVTSPHVTVVAKEYRPFFILGEVRNPGAYPYVPGMTVLTAVAIAGGFTYRAANGDVAVTRKVEGVTREMRAPRHARILPGDVVYVYERHL